MKTIARGCLLLAFCCLSCASGSDQAPLSGSPRSNALVGGITFRAQSTYWAWSMDTQTISLVVPAAVQANDVLIANIYVGDYSTPSLPVITAPSGWALLQQISDGSAGLLLIYSRVALASDAGATFSWASNGWVGAASSLLAYSGVDPAAPVEVSAVQDNPAAASIYSTPAVTTVSSNAVLIATYAAYSPNTPPSTSWSAPAGMTQRVNINNNGKLLSISNDEIVQSVAGPSGTFSATATPGQGYALTALLALKPGSCTPTTCAAQSKNCGSIADGCGGTLNCGTCTAPQTCGGGGTANVCGTSTAGNINFRAQSTYWAMSMDTQTISLTVPAAVQANDALIANIYVGDYSTPSLPVITAPAGWTLVRQVSHGTAALLLIYSRVADATDAGKTYSWTSNGWVGAASSLLAYSGVDPAAPVEVSAAQDNPASAASYSTPAVTTLSANAMLIATYAAYTQNIPPSGSWSVPTGMTQRVNINNNAKLLSISNDDVVKSAAGGSGTFAATATPNPIYALTALLALKPGGTCVPTTCAAQGKNCDSLPDGCGGTLSCGACTAPQTCGGAGAPGVCGAAAVDPFGVTKIYPTRSGGREWYLPPTADQADAEWKPSSGVTKIAADGVFHMENVQVRSSVASPAGKAWWRNVEMTGYVRQTGTIAGSTQAVHWSWYARGERHSHNATAPADINGGVLAPAGTATWPGYPYSGTSVRPECLGTAYHSGLYANAQVFFEKEISHTAGYVAPADRRGQAPVAGLDLSQWTGYKFVLRNDPTQTTVTLEIWLDAPAGSGWRKISAGTDSGGWNAGNPPAGVQPLDGCDSAPFNYAVDQKITWAGPLATFRSDSVGYDFKWFSVREIDEGP